MTLLNRIVYTISIGIFFLGCGGGGGGSTPPPVVVHAPGISNLQFSPSSATKGAGGGAVSVTGSFNFTDGGGDLTSFTITNYYSTGQISSSGTFPITGTGGVTVGSIALYLNVATTVADNFRFEAYATDTAGSKSNQLSGNFLITDTTPTTHAPSISNFQFTPASVTQGSGGGTATTVGNFSFTDAGGDMATVTYTFYNTSGVISGTNTGPITGIAGVASGSVQTTFTASTGTVGNLRMDVFTTDNKGSSSNTLSQVFRVVAPTQVTPIIGGECSTGPQLETGYQFMTLQGARLISGVPPTWSDTLKIQGNTSKAIE